MEGAPKLTPLEQKVLKTKEVLTFEEFISQYPSNRMPVYNNLHAYFNGNKESFLSNTLRSQGFFKRFQQENPELEKSLISKISETRKEREFLPSEEVLRELYEAYKILISYEEIKTNQELFR